MRPIDCKKYISTNYCNKTKTINTYFEDIRKYTILTKNKENELLIKAKNCTGVEQTEAIHSLINCNQRFVISVALKYANNDNLLDLVSEGNIGLMEAIKRFDIDKDCKFITYAVWWIRKYILNYMINKEKLITPPNANKLYGKVTKIKNNFFQQEQREPTLSEIKDIIYNDTGLNIENLSDIEDFVSVSIDSNLNAESDEMQGCVQFDVMTSTNNIDEIIEDYDNKEIVKRLLANFNERDKKIIKYSFGIDCDPLTNEQIGRKFNLSGERIRQIRTLILKKMMKTIEKC